MIQQPNYNNHYFHKINPTQCSVKSLTGMNCPEIGIYEIYPNHYLCERCYKNWLKSNRSDHQTPYI